MKVFGEAGKWMSSMLELCKRGQRRVEKEQKRGCVQQLRTNDCKEQRKGRKTRRGKYETRSRETRETRETRESEKEEQEEEERKREEVVRCPIYKPKG